jgi:hypothetical protein
VFVQAAPVHQEYWENRMALRPDNRQANHWADDQTFARKKFAEQETPKAAEAEIAVSVS